MNTDICTFIAISLYILFITTKICRENQNTHFISNSFFFFRKLFRLRDNVEKSTKGTVVFSLRCRMYRSTFEDLDIKPAKESRC